MSIDTVCQVINGQWVNPRNRCRPVRGVSVDTRTMRPRNAFFCLRGERADGHRYAPRARDRRAGAIIAERGRAGRWRAWPVPVIGVDDPLTALGDLAMEFRGHFPTRYIAVTGSVGKTTTKEMIAAALSARYSVYKSPGNYNNLIGIPLALLGRNPQEKQAARYGVLEFGMSTPGEIARLTRIVAPVWGVVTRIAPSHVLQLRSLAAVARAKKELFDNMSHTGVAFLNNDDPRQVAWHRGWSRSTVTYALHHDADVTADSLQMHADGTVAFRVNHRHPFTLALPGNHNIANALAAVAVARRFGVAFGDIAARLRRVRPPGQRSRVVHTGGVILLEDCYNANPVSVGAALETLAAWPGRKRRIAVLGAMRELGTGEVKWHRRMGRLAGRHIDLLITVGSLAREIAAAAEGGRRGIPVITCRTKKETVNALRRLVAPGDVVLLKASRSEGFEDIASALHRLRRRGQARDDQRNGD